MSELRALCPSAFSLFVWIVIFRVFKVYANWVCLFFGLVVCCFVFGLLADAVHIRVVRFWKKKIVQFAYWKCCLISSSVKVATLLSLRAFSAFSTSLGLKTSANLPSKCTADE